jgi:NAD+ kinase
VNLGGLGFLTAVEHHDLRKAVHATLTGAWPVVARRLVGVTARRQGQVALRAAALNDAVVREAGGFGAVHLGIHVDGADLGHLVADGTVVATSSGSTAYSLSAGGPVVAPDLDALVITPVCPHTLASRALVVSERAHVRMSLLGPDRGVVLLDGHDRATLERGDELEFALTRQAVRLVRRPDLPWAATLATKLGWQGSERRSL